MIDLVLYTTFYNYSCNLLFSPVSLKGLTDLGGLIILKLLLEFNFSYFTPYVGLMLLAKLIDVD